MIKYRERAFMLDLFHIFTQKVLMKISQALVEAFFKQIFAQIREEDCTDLLSNTYFYQNIEKAGSLFAQNAFEYSCLKRLLQKQLEAER